jgi:hypothetical protein
MTNEPSPFATHADLSLMRREMQQDLRAEMRDLARELRLTLKDMEDKGASAKQWAYTTFFSVANLALVFWYGSRH